MPDGAFIKMTPDDRMEWLWGQIREREATLRDTIGYSPFQNERPEVAFVWCFDALVRERDEARDEVERLRVALVYLADLHHRTRTGSRKHDPENREWRDCDCASCLYAQFAMTPASTPECGRDEGAPDA